MRIIIEIFRWFTVFVALTSCSYFVSWADVNQRAVGHSIQEIIDLWGSPNMISGQETKKIYRYDLKKLDPTCVHYWIVNEEGVIVDFYYEGYCRPI